MIFKIFSVYDSKAEAYLLPFYEVSTASALRSFEQICNEPKHSFCKYPADFTLFQIATFDDSTATVTPLTTHVNLGKASEFLKQQSLDLAQEDFFIEMEKRYPQLLKEQAI